MTPLQAVGLFRNGFCTSDCTHGARAQDDVVFVCVCLVVCVVVVLVATLGRLSQVRSISRNNRGITKAGALATYKSTVQEGLDKELAELGVPPMAFPVLFIDALGRCSLPTCA